MKVRKSDNSGNAVGELMEYALPGPHIISHLISGCENNSQRYGASGPAFPLRPIPGIVYPNAAQSQQGQSGNLVLLRPRQTEALEDGLGFRDPL